MCKTHFWRTFTRSNWGCQAWQIKSKEKSSDKNFQFLWVESLGCLCLKTTLLLSRSNTSQKKTSPNFQIILFQWPASNIFLIFQQVARFFQIQFGVMTPPSLMKDGSSEENANLDFSKILISTLRVLEMSIMTIIYSVIQCVIQMSKLWWYRCPLSVGFL